MVHFDISVVFFVFTSLVAATPVDQRSPGVLRIPILRKAGTLTAAELVAKEKLRIASFANFAVGTQPITNDDGKYMHILILSSQLTSHLHVVTYVTRETCVILAYIDQLNNIT